MKKIIPRLSAFVFLIAIMGSCNGGGRKVSTATCKSCGRTFQAGDDAGNYRNIARTHMCNNCYNNYKWAKDVMGK